MKAIAILSRKGGSGKTTLAVHLAVLAWQEGNRVVLIDCDPQKSAGDWWRAREDDEPILVETAAEGLSTVLEAARGDSVDVAFIDTAPHADTDATAAARVADLALIPCRPSILDLRAIGATVDLLNAIRKPAAIILNSCPPSRWFGHEAGITVEARKGLKHYGVPVAPASVTRRAAFEHALIDGRAVSEFQPEGKAAAEIAALWAWLQEQTR